MAVSLGLAAAEVGGTAAAGSAATGLMIAGAACYPRPGVNDPDSERQRQVGRLMAGSGLYKDTV